MVSGVPLNVIWVVVPEQIVVAPEIVAVGNAVTVTVTELLIDWEQIVFPAESKTFTFNKL